MAVDQGVLGLLHYSCRSRLSGSVIVLLKAKAGDLGFWVCYTTAVGPGFLGLL